MAAGDASRATTFSTTMPGCLQMSTGASLPCRSSSIEALIDHMQGKTEKPGVLKYAEADKKILGKMKADALEYRKAPPWFNEVDPTQPLFLQVQAINERQAVKECARKLQQEQEGIEDDWADSDDSAKRLAHEQEQEKQRRSEVEEKQAAKQEDIQAQLQWEIKRTRRRRYSR